MHLQEALVKTDYVSARPEWPVDCGGSMFSGYSVHSFVV